MVRRWEFVAAILILIRIPTVAHASEREPHVLVRFAPEVPRPDAERLVSAMRAQLREAATVDLEPGPMSPTCVVDVDRTESGIVLRFTDGVGRRAGAPRFVARSGEIGASEAATIVRAFVVAEKERAAEKETEGTREKPSSERHEPPAAAPSPDSASADTSWPTYVPAVTDRGAAAPSASPEPWRARIAAMYTGATYAPELPWHSGARFEGAYAFVPGLYAGLTVAVHPATEMKTEAAPVRVSRRSTALFMGLESRGREWVLGADAAVGLEDMTRSTSAGVALADAARVIPIFAARLHGRWRIPNARGVAIDIAPTFELALGQERLVVESGDTATRSTPAVARFRMDAGTTFDLF